MERYEIREIISAFPVFSKLGEAQLEMLIDNSLVNEIPKNAVFYSEEKSGQGMHVLLDGRVKLFKISEDGKEQTIFVFGPGEPFCLCSVFSDGRLPANMQALRPSKVLVISPSHFERMTHEDPTILLSMLKVMSRRLKEAMDMIDSLSLKQVPSRVAAYFLSRQKDGRVEMDISYRELSKIIGVTPEALSRALKKMREDDVIDMEGNAVTLTDLETLESY
ncbi:cyclic nucleotide-binding domain-containing protein [Pseudodesulfovibrio cashew]|uniref:Cyclic nucleotide-binding domain-containing protein n=1 Tax=Pseudodesulfovibrio cashew TaxID=2678688 RepID=A0A6I6JES8_9BACT|nr:Crp/Fnr family transcriptional regulator [Pseudodesulfovibrio cashew]QGY38922.1 cyclic nucleotide-binding domain-containing protein [Pseudodesulfovibrio cashew]